MKCWSWLMAIALGTSTLMIVGCGGDDDDDEDAATPEASSAAAATATNATATPSVTSKVLMDKRVNASGGAGFSVIHYSDPTPQAGKVTITATWTASDLIAGGAPIDIPLEFRVNEGVAGAGSFRNAGANSPFTGAVGMPEGLKCKIVVINNVNDSTATVRLRAVWTAN